MNWTLLNKNKRLTWQQRCTKTEDQARWGTRRTQKGTGRTRHGAWNTLCSTEGWMKAEWLWRLGLMEEVAADAARETGRKTGKAFKLWRDWRPYRLKKDILSCPILLPHLFPQYISFGLFPFSAFLPPIFFPLLSMKRTQVIDLEQKASGLRGPEAHYVSHNKLEAWTCCE